MSTQIQSGTWTEDGADLLSNPVINFFARRRILISLVGFIGCVLFNLFALRTIPWNPLALTHWPVGLAWLFLLLGLAIRSWAAGSLNKSRHLTQTGPYALTRNPLYLGSFLIMAAYCLLLRDLPSLLFALGPLTALYRLQVHFEEKRLLFLFPQEWPGYAARVPRWLPQAFPPAACEGWSWFEWKRNREFRLLLGTLAGVVAVTVWHTLSLQLWL